ncbi:MAG: thioredoxin family protein [Desulfobacterales bacterium]|nr:thioredoxin family protein [Desulfobacterales bacterium]MDJ0875508.1 thioredoxin family protein [Desulfobacterales bacterium]
MLKYKIGLILVLAILAGLILIPHKPDAAPAAKVKWHTYKAGTDLARRQNKNMVIYFHADWCTYCGQMERETFGDAAVIEMLNNRAIAIKVDVDIEKRVARQFGVRGLPATFLLLNNGEQIGPLPGFIPPRAYLAMLSRILSQT